MYTDVCGGGGVVVCGGVCVQICVCVYADMRILINTCKLWVSAKQITLVLPGDGCTPRFAIPGKK